MVDIKKYDVMQVFDSSRKVKDAFKSKHVKCIRASQGKIYVGCMDSSIQVGYNRHIYKKEKKIKQQVIYVIILIDIGVKYWKQPATTNQSSIKELDDAKQAYQFNISVQRPAM